MVNLEEASFWQESARTWYKLAKEPIAIITEDEIDGRMHACKAASYGARYYMGITDQDQLYA